MGRCLTASKDIFDVTELWNNNGMPDATIGSDPARTGQAGPSKTEEIEWTLVNKQQHSGPHRIFSPST